MARFSARRLTTLLAASALALGLATTAASAATVRVTVNGSQWDVSTVLDTFSNQTSLLSSQIWWGDRALAASFAGAVNSQLGLPNAFGRLGPFFTYALDPGGSTNSFAAAFLGVPTFGGAFISDSRTYAIAAPVVAPVPLPAGAALLLTGIAAAFGLRRRKQQTA